VTTRQTRVQRGRRSGEAAVSSVLNGIRDQRVGLGLSQQSVAVRLGCSQSHYSRFESGADPQTVRIVRVAEVAALLGLELSVRLHPAGVAMRDAGHQALIRRLRGLLHASFAVRAEVHFPGPGDPRVWDLVMRHGDVLIGVEAETRIRDLQALVRRVRGRERDGGVDQILLLLSDSRFNRRLADELRVALGEQFKASPRRLLTALREGRPLPGSGVLLL
jgi:transcriptional regulator with XRE-family HTH domain